MAMMQSDQIGLAELSLDPVSEGIERHILGACFGVQLVIGDDLSVLGERCVELAGTGGQVEELGGESAEKMREGETQSDMGSD